MKNFLKKSILPAVISILFLATILAFLMMLITYHKPLLKSVGIYINDDCHFSSFNRLSCSYINVSNRKNFFFKIRDLSLYINYKNLFSKGKVFHLYADFIDGRISPEEKKKEKKKYISFQPLFYILRLSSIHINSFSLLIEKKNPVFIKNASLSTKENKITILRPFYINLGNERIYVKDIKGKYTDTYLDITPFEIEAGGFFVNGGLQLDRYANLSLNGKILAKRYKKTVSIKNIEGEFSLNGNINTLLKGKASYKIGNIYGKNFHLNALKGNLTISIADGIYGKNLLYIKDFSARDIYAANMNLVSNFSFKDLFQSKNALTVENMKISKTVLKNLSSEFDIKKDSSFLIDGKVFYRDIFVKYFLSLGEKSILDLDVPEYNIKKVLSVFNIKNRYLSDLSFLFKGKYTLDLKKLTGKGKIFLRDINLFGVSFKSGEVDVRQNIKKNTAHFQADLKGEGTLKGKGYIKGKYIDTDILYKGIDISDLSFTKKIGLGGNFSGKGKIYGNIPDIQVSLEGTASSFKYKNLLLKDYEYTFLFKDKKINILAKNSDKNLLVNTDITFYPFSFNLSAEAKNADLQPFYPFLKDMLPNLFSNIKPLKATGKFSVLVKKNDFFLSMDIKKGKVLLIPAGDYVNANLKGKISKKDINMKVYFYKNSFSYQKDVIFDSIKGLFVLKNKTGNLNIEAKGLNKVDFFHLFGALTLKMDKKSINGDIFSTFKLKDYKTVLNANITGSFDAFSGVMFTEIYLKGKKFTENFLNYSLKRKKNIFLLDFYSTNLDFFVNDTLEFIAKKPVGQIKIGKDIKGFLSFKTLLAYQNKLTLFKTNPVKLTFDKTTLHSGNISFSGLLSGNIKKITFSFPEKYLYLKASGNIDKQLLSELIMFGTVDGSLKYTLMFDGSVSKNPEKHLFLHAFSKNLKLRSSYLRGIIKFDTFDIFVKEGKANILGTGKTSSLVSGESKVNISGNINLTSLKNNLSINTKLLPVRYPSIFEGSTSADIKTYSKREKVLKQFIEGDISVSGRLRLDPDIQKQFSKAPSQGEKEEKNLENIILNLSIKTFSPVYIYGKWGSAYGESILTVKGTAKKPIVNGFINIVYGKINYMKNKYNIDYAKIKIIENQPYISARLSTVVANTFIYININGNLKNPNLSFTSIPPKSKNEILSILLFKDSPGALESIPLFTAIGKIIYAFLPFGTEEDKGLFNTGFNVTIVPSYNPLYGITASLYARKNLSRRFYIAFSRPIREVEGINIFGWYEIGVNITEQTSLQFRWYENQDEEVHIMFSLPFDF